jgi:hypothetical protein
MEPGPARTAIARTNSSTFFREALLSEEGRQPHILPSWFRLKFSRAGLGDEPGIGGVNRQ